MGVRNAFEVVLVHLNPWTLVRSDLFPGNSIITGSKLPGVVIFLARAVTALVATRLGNRALVRLHVVVAVALLVALVTVSRLGAAWYYRFLWSWGVAVLLLMAVGWNVACSPDGS